MKAERLLFPLILVNSLIPIALSLFALWTIVHAHQTATAINRSAALRDQSLYIYSLTQTNSKTRAWSPTLQRMEQARSMLNPDYAAELALSEAAWQKFKGQLQTTGRVDWTTTQAMHQAAGRQTWALSSRMERDRSVLLAVMLAGIVSLFLGCGKSYELLRQLTAARAAQQESEQRFSKLAEASFEGILLSQNGVVVMINDQICTMTSYTAPEVIGQRADLLVTPEERERVRLKIESNDERPYTTWMLRKDGSPVPIEIEGKTIQFQGAPARVIACRDISECQRIESELRAANQRLEQMASLDELMGLFNRRAFNVHFKTELERAHRYATPLSLLLLDIDRFKSFNDQWGHDYGDEVLRVVSQILKETVRPSDFVARYGGEEMIIILPHTDQDGAITSAERCRLALENTQWPHQPLTVSVGAATLCPALSTADQLIKAVDSALYHSKTTGRNRTTHCATMPTNTPLA